MNNGTQGWLEILECVDCLLIDVGGVLFHDESVDLFFHSWIYMALLEIGALQPGQESTFFRNRERILAQSAIDWIHAYGEPLAGSHWSGIVSLAWDATLKRWPELYRPCQGAPQALERLTIEKRLACVANQPAETGPLLRHHGMATCFEQILLDSESGLCKPNPLFFMLALDRLGVEPQRAAYLGDRLDNDIRPAKRLGLRTVWLRRPPKRFQIEGVPTDFATAHGESLDRLWHHNQFADTSAADLTVPSLSFLANELPGDTRPWIS